MNTNTNNTVMQRAINARLVPKNHRVKMIDKFVVGRFDGEGKLIYKLNFMFSNIIIATFRYSIDGVVTTKWYIYNNNGNILV